MRINWYDPKNDPVKYIKQVQAEKQITRKEAEKIVRKWVPKEGDFQAKIKEAIKERYPQALVVKIAQGEYSQAGIPDLMAIIDGHFFGFEVKRPYFNKKSELQKKTVKWIREAGGTADFISYREEALDIIEAYFKTGR